MCIRQIKAARERERKERKKKANKQTNKQTNKNSHLFLNVVLAFLLERQKCRVLVKVGFRLVFCMKVLTKYDF